MVHLPSSKRLRAPPSEQDRTLEWQFLTDHWQYGGTIHETTARALVVALNTPSDPATGHSLFLRLFTEYATAIENLGAWGWTFRNYRRFPLFLDAFLSYPHAAPREFYRAVRRNRSGSLALLLQLPRRKGLERAVAGDLELQIDEYAGMADKCMRNLRVAAQQYIGASELVRITYNKAKHGTTMVRPRDLTDPREFYVITEGRGSDRYDLTKFRVDKNMIRTVARGVEGAGLCTRFLAGIARGLLATGNLYPEYHPGAVSVELARIGSPSRGAASRIIDGRTLPTPNRTTTA